MDYNVLLLYYPKLQSVIKEHKQCFVNLDYPFEWKYILEYTSECDHQLVDTEH